jgi:hypothetical protein
MNINKGLIRELITWTLTTLAIGILIAILINALTKGAHANEIVGVQNLEPLREPLPVGNTLNFAAGMATAYLIHESGHIIAGRLTHTDMHFHSFENGQLLSFDMHPESDSDGLWVSTAGLNAQLICSEAILRSRTVDRHDPFVRGMMTWNVINPVLYSLDYWFLHKWNKTENGHFQGDLQCVEYYSDKHDANLFALSVSLLALYDGYRFLKPPNLDSKYRFNLSALPGGGAFFSRKIEF